MNTRAINRIHIPIFAGILAFGIPGQVQAGYQVTASGSGNSERAATDRALQTALGKIVESYAPAHTSKGRKLAWIRRLVQAHPRHVVGTHFKTVKRNSPANDRANRQWNVTVDVNIPKAQLDSAWQEAEAFIGWIGHPTVAIFMVDRIEDNRHRPARITTAADSDVAQQFREALHNEHFEVKVSDQVDVLKSTHGEFARLNQQDLKVITEIATRQNADIFLTGVGRTLGPTPHSRTPGRQGYDWESDAKCNMYWTDDATLIATIDADGLGEDNDPDRGRITSLKNVGNGLAPKFMDAIFREWSVWAFEGRAVTITVLGCSNDQADAIEDLIESLPESDVIEILDAQPANNTTVIRVQSKQAPRKLSRKIRKADYDGFKLEGMEARYNTIRLKVAN